MNKKTLVLSAALLTILSSTVMAQSSVWLDVRPNDSGSGIRTISGTIQAGALGPFANDTVNGGKRGQGQVVYLEPKAPDGWESVNTVQKNGNSFPNFDADLNHSTGDLWIYMDVEEDVSGVGDVISSVGLDIDTRLVGATMRNKIASMAVTLDNANTVFNSITPAGGSPWNNKVDGEVEPATDPIDWQKAKAVRVPVDPGPVYNAALGIQPRPVTASTVTPYRLGKIRLTAGTRNCSGRTVGLFVPNSSYDLFLEVNNLLITRVYNGAGDATEMVQFGYGAPEGAPAAVPEAPAVSGSTAGAVSAVADGRVVIRLKGDFNGDGNVTGGDNGAYTTAAISDGTDNQLATYLGDFNGNNSVTGADSGASGAGGSFFLHSQTRSGFTPCP